MAETYDIYFQAKHPDTVEGFKFLTFGYNRTIGVRGFWKLICLWLRRFLTPRGSDPVRPNDGTDFMKLIGYNISSSGDLRDVVLLAIEECNEQIYTLQQTTQPELNETLNTAVLSNFELTGGAGIEVYVTISNAAGESIQIRLPDLATRT